MVFTQGRWQLRAVGRWQPFRRWGIEALRANAQALEHRNVPPPDALDLEYLVEAAVTGRPFGSEGFCSPTQAPALQSDQEQHRDLAVLIWLCPASRLGDLGWLVFAAARGLSSYGGGTHERPSLSEFLACWFVGGPRWRSTPERLDLLCSFLDTRRLGAAGERARQMVATAAAGGRR